MDRINWTEITVTLTEYIPVWRHHSQWTKLLQFCIFISVYLKSVTLFFLINIFGKFHSLSVGHYELCRDDIGDLPGSPEHLWLRENANEIG